MVESILLMGGLGLVIGAGLAAASKIFYVYVDPQIVAVEEALPGANCGGCGLPGCSANAEAIVKGKAAPNSCVAGGPDLATTIAAILGVAVEAKEPDIALPGCNYGLKDADVKFEYNGINNCRAAALISGGMKVCSIGCLGLGSCVKACPFGALEMGKEGLPVVNESKCTGCGTCERVCPKHIITLSSVTRRIMKEYTKEDCTTPCQRACPAGIDIREYINQINIGNYEKAVQIIKERNPFPTVIGRICPRPCEQECRRILQDEPVAINYLKRFVSDYEMEKGKRVLPYKAPETGKKIAIIGGGVEGMSTAFFSARLGHESTIFEADSKLGGILRSAIEKCRLPHEILDWDIEGIIEMGAKVEFNQTCGKDFTLEKLLNDGFNAVFIASGGWDSRLSRGKLSETQKIIPGIYLMIDFIKSNDEKSWGKNVVIVGNGKAALDAALKAKKYGDSVSILLKDFSDNLPKNFNLENEGIKIISSSAITKFFGKGDELIKIECINLQTNEKSIIPADTVLLSSGRMPQLIIRKADEPENDLWEGIEAYKNPLYAEEQGILANGDEFTDFKAAIKAIGAGRRATVSIHQIINGMNPYLPEKVLSQGTFIQNIFHLENVQPVSRQIMPIANSAELSEGIKIEKGFNEEMAKAESKRCLQCGLICYKH
ncbi:MAG: RnfABCDGE type electron transport complex subunit B [Desulfobacterales bacterium]|nr:RnfABCDGE type electron transport complex subunit B [Desulfobacterales bacterium]